MGFDSRGIRARGMISWELIPKPAARRRLILFDLRAGARARAGWARALALFCTALFMGCRLVHDVRCMSGGSNVSALPSNLDVLGLIPAKGKLARKSFKLDLNYNTRSYPRIALSLRRARTWASRSHNYSVAEEASNDYDNSDVDDDNALNVDYRYWLDDEISNDANDHVRDD
ncbi:hypothetical protein EVAR_91055_1 [Eumeta japonica]|uniref:Uncharacterized protein n=1 Tax=Eumeta variegata TaxID=151549 RepID=A0A4C1Z7T9_EUMVA|nr:hypothetical protein EVAR_91055_1 [Eumeta japonica]